MKHTESHKIKCNFVEINEISENTAENLKIKAMDRKK